LLPWPEIQLALGHRHDHLVVHQQAFQVGIAIGFARTVMAILLAERRQLFQPFIDVGN